MLRHAWRHGCVSQKYCLMTHIKAYVQAWPCLASWPFFTLYFTLDQDFCVLPLAGFEFIVDQSFHRIVENLSLKMRIWPFRIGW